MMCIYSGYQLIDVNPKEDTVTIRGVNVFQAFYDQNRWWITYCTYEEESPGILVPAVLGGPAKKEGE
jgi:hypothetical protein